MTSKPAKRPLHRKLHIGDEVWSYRFGKHAVVVRSPDLKVTTSIHFQELLGLDAYGYERLLWKNPHLCQVTPSMIKDYILEHVLATKK